MGQRWMASDGLQGRLGAGFNLQARLNDRRLCGRHVNSADGSKRVPLSGGWTCSYGGNDAG